MLDWQTNTDYNTPIETVTLTKENASEVMTFLLDRGFIIAGNLTPAVGAPLSIKVNGSEVTEGDTIFRGVVDDALGFIPAVKAEV